MDIRTIAKHLPPGRGRTWSLAGGVYTLLMDGSETGGAYALFDTRVPPHAGTPMHVHEREDEAFYVIDGELTFEVEGRTIVAPPGAFLSAVRNVPHCFQNRSDAPARALVLIAPAGFEEFVEELGVPMNDPLAPPAPFGPGDVQRLMAVAPRYGIQILTPSRA